MGSALMSVLALVVAAPPTTAPASGLDTQGRRMVALVEKVRPVLATVQFVVTRRQGEQVQRVAGTVRGILVDDTGLVMTIGEIYPRTADRIVGTTAVDPPKDIRVILQDGTEAEATFVGKDYDLNLGFVRMKTAPAGVSPLPLAGAGSLSVGQAVTLFGRLPEHYGRKVWFMPVRISAMTATPRELCFASVQILRILGGPALDADGRLVGVVALDTRNIRPENDPTGRPRLVSSAVIVPAWSFAPLIANPPTLRPARQDGWLGIGMDALTKDLAEALGLSVTSGVMVSRVYPGTPAEKAGLKAEDVIVAVDGKPLTVSSTEELAEFRTQVVAAGAGAKMTLTIARGGTRQDVTVTLAGSPKSVGEAERVKLDDFAFTAREIVFTDTVQPGLGPEVDGVVVAAVERAGWAGLGGLRSGDIIQRVNDLPVRTLAEFRAHIQTIRKGKPEEVVFFIRRGTETTFIRAQPQWK